MWKNRLPLLAGVLWATLLVAGGLARAQNTSANPIVLTQDSLIAGTTGTVAYNPGANRVYVGRWYSYDPQRLNLLVLTLDKDGKTVGTPRRYRDSPLPLPAQTHSTVQTILVDAARRKLYLTYGLSAATPPDATRLLTVYDLDANGEPVGPPRAYEAGNPNKSLLGLARHPKHNLLYMVGWGGAGVYVYGLDAKGEPQGEPKAFPVGGQGKFEIAVSPGGERLYLGTYPDTLEVVELDADGFPTGTPHSFTAGTEQAYLRFASGPRALYLLRPTPEGTRLAVWPINEQGEPQGKPQVQAITASTVAVDTKNNQLWLAGDSTFKDPFSGKVIVDGIVPTSLPIRPDGMVEAPGRQYPSTFRQKGAAMAVTNGAPVLLTQSLPYGFLGNRFSDYRLRLTLQEVRLRNGTTPPTLPVVLDINNKSHNVGQVTPGKPTDWINLDPFLKDQAGVLLARVNAGNVYGDLFAPDNIAQMTTRFELVEGDPAAGGKVLKTMTDTTQSGTVVAILPAYGYEPPTQRMAAIELLSEHAKMYLAAARQSPLKPEERPRRFVISPYHLMGGQGHIEQLKMTAEALSLLGFNTANCYAWPGIEPKTIDSILDEHGIGWRSQAIYSPPTYFAFDREKMNPAALDKWAQEMAKVVPPQNGGTVQDVREFFLADEPGWYYPTMLQEVRNNPQFLQEFRTYLQGKGLKPADVGGASWDEIFPQGAEAAVREGASLPTRRLFYWTMRFYPESASQGHKLAREALDRAYGHRIPAAVNWNNWPGAWYSASPNKKIANNPIADPNSAMGSFDWFESGRIDAHTLWSEDWFGDQSAQVWSFYGDLLRSAALAGITPTGTGVLQSDGALQSDGSVAPPMDFGSYVIGGTTGSFTGGTRYKVMSLVGHGAKRISFFSWGPELLFPGNCWSEAPYIYPNIADAMRMVGRAERLLFPGRAERGRVAIFMPTGSALWEKDQHHPHYNQELWGLHHALIHAGYTIDFVDDTEVARGELARRNYTTLYLTGPNVAQAAQEQIAVWVRAGGTLVATPGAGVADEFNTPTTLLDTVLGLESRTAVRDAAPQPSTELPVTDTLKITNARIGFGDVQLRGPVAPLRPKGAAVMAALKSGAAGITASRFGQGRGISYAFFPGWQYWLTPDRSERSRLPQGWGAPQRSLAVVPARIAETPRPVIVSREGVEACRLNSEKGIAIVLLNWTGDTGGNITVTVPGSKFRKVTSLENGTVQAVPAGDGLKITLPLKDVDVLMLE